MISDVSIHSCSLSSIKNYEIFLILTSRGFSFNRMPKLSNSLYINNLCVTAYPASSTIIIVDSGTSTPTSTTVVATNSPISWAAIEK